jgi:hypothetical protein
MQSPLRKGCARPPPTPTTRSPHFLSRKTCLASKDILFREIPSHKLPPEDTASTPTATRGGPEAPRVCDNGFQSKTRYEKKLEKQQLPHTSCCSSLLSPIKQLTFTSQFRSHLPAGEPSSQCKGLRGNSLCAEENEPSPPRLQKQSKQGPATLPGALHLCRVALMALNAETDLRGLAEASSATVLKGMEGVFLNKCHHLRWTKGTSQTELS